jgi:uncharacterized protein (UPF0297 family)
MGFVYRWHDNSNGKYYVGSHKGNIDSKYVGSGILFKRAYKKRPESFEREILYVGNDYHEVEELVLLTLDAAADEKSYNMKNAAIGGNMGADAIMRMSEKKMGVKFTDSHKEKMSQSMTKYRVYCEINGKTYNNSKDVITDFSYSPSYVRQMLNQPKHNILKLQKIYK